MTRDVADAMAIHEWFATMNELDMNEFHDLFSLSLPFFLSLFGMRENVRLYLFVMDRQRLHIAQNIIFTNCK